MRSTEDMIRQEVHYCVSGLVSTLAYGYEHDFGPIPELAALSDLCGQALDLSVPVIDYEEALIQEGYSRVDDGWAHPDYGWFGESAQDLCEIQNIEPDGREVYEHWIVSDWLADKLAEKGEKVDKDFAGMTVWARTTTGQAIFLDSVIEGIVADLTREHGG